MNCRACGWQLPAGSISCPSCDAEVIYHGAPCPCDICKTERERHPRFLDGTPKPPERSPVADRVGELCEVLESLDKRSQLEAQFAAETCAKQEPPTSYDPLCDRCVAILRERFHGPRDTKQASEKWWAEELARLSYAGTWADLRAGIINASNKVLKLADLMEKQENESR